PSVPAVRKFARPIDRGRPAGGEMNGRASRRHIVAATLLASLAAITSAVGHASWAAPGPRSRSTTSVPHGHGPRLRDMLGHRLAGRFGPPLRRWAISVGLDQVLS